jgi:hypothetical protein
MKRILLYAALVISILVAPGTLMAQDVSGMTGTVTDSSGAALPGAVVVLTNKTTGVKFTQTVTASGNYRFADVPPGAGYEAIFSISGFAPLDVKNIYLTVATVRTQNATLTAGANQEIEVTASNSEVTIDTTDATIGNTFDVKQLNSLPVQQRNDPTALFTLQPGVTDTASTTGARSDQNDITLDGLDVNDFATGGSVQSNSGISQGFTIVGHAPVDSVEEFHGTVAGLGATSGPSSGGQFALVTKSGTNSFHGNINEYHRDPSLVSNGWYNNNASPIVARNHLIQNQFGGNIGGPILKDKLFFFFDYNNSRIISSESTTRTVPLTTFRNGIIQYINSENYVPGTSTGLGQVTPAQVQALDPANIGEATNWFTAFNARFPMPNSTSSGDLINSGGYTFNAPNNDFETNYVGRADYQLTSKQRVYARFTISRENSTEALNEFANDPATSPFIDRTYAFVIHHDWAINDHMSNGFFIGETVEKYAFPITYNPDGSTFFTFGDGTGTALASSFYLQPNAQARRIPVPVIGDDFTYTKGSHTFQMGGTFKDILAHDTNVADYNTVQLGMGGHLFALCGPTPGECASGNAALSPTASLRPSDLDENGANFGNTAVYTYDQAFAFALARIGNVNSDYNYNATGSALPQLSGDQRFYRYYQTQLYAADSWKVTHDLTMSYGVNYQYFSVPYETHGLESVEPITYDQYMQARVQQSTAGQTGPYAVPVLTYYLGGKKNNGPGLYKPEYRNIAPRVAFAYNPSWDKKTVFNASAGIVYDRTIINAVQAIQDLDSYLFQLTNPIAEGNPADPYDSIKTDPRLDKNNGISTVPLAAPTPPKAPYQPFANAGSCGSLPTPCGLALGSAFNATIDPSLKTPYSISFNGGFQRSLRYDFVLKVNYAGRLGRRLLAQADANQVLDFTDAASGQLYSQAVANVTKELRAGQAVTPQPWFENQVSGYGAPGTITAALAASGLGPFLLRGDIGDFTQGLSQVSSTTGTAAIAQNVGSASQFSENSFYTNKGSSSYNALLLTLSRNLSHGLQFDFNYTFAHSIDNTSFFANSEGDTGIGGVGLVCDDIRPRECRANSDFDEKQYITADFTYQLPFGRGRAFYAGTPVWVNELIGGWDISGITDWHTGQAWGTNSNAFDASYSNDAPAILVGPKSAVATHLTKLPGGGVNIFANQAAAAAAYVGPIGFQIGARNSLRGPNFFDQDLGLAKTFPVYKDGVNLKFRADAFNVLNHPNFGLPQSNSFNGFDQQDVTNTSAFGQISSTVTPSGNLNNGARVLQVSLRLEF